MIYFPAELSVSLEKSFLENACLVVTMVIFVVVKFDNVPTYGTNPYKCVPSWWVSESDSTNVTVPYPSKYRIFDDFRCIITRQPPSDGWKKYTGTIVHGTETYHEGLQFIHTQDPSYFPEELIFIKFLSANNRTSRKKSPLTKLGLRIRWQFRKLFKI